MAWSTFDRDNDNFYDRCAVASHGARWYNGCQFSNLNGLYNSTSDWTAESWAYWLGRAYPLKATEMKIRPAV